VLLVDDQPIGLIAIAGVLRAAGCDVHALESPLEALAAAAAGPFDLIFVDAMMPEMDGFEVCRRVRSMRTATPPLLVILTALDEETAQRLAADAGADGISFKPLPRAEMLEWVRRAAEGVAEARR